MNKYGFFSSINGDRKYSAEDFCGYFKDIFTDGILGDSAANLRVSVSGGMKISISAGTAFLRGHFYRPDEAERLTVASADTSYGRKDRVVIRLDMEQRSIYPAIIAGVPSASPSAPDIVRVGSYYDIGIAVIDVAANTVALTAPDITDTRFDNAVCGIVTGVVDTIDTADLFAQYEARWNMLMAGFSGDEAEIIAAFNALLTVKTVNGIAPADSGGNVVLTLDDIPDGTAKKLDKTVKCGTVTASSSGIGEVVFDTPFSDVPVVTATTEYNPNGSESDASKYPKVCIDNVTAAGFTVRTRNENGSATMEHKVHWIAMGV